MAGFARLFDARHCDIVLASTSPRRLEILSKFFPSLQNCAPSFDEASIPWNAADFPTPASYVELMARKKAESSLHEYRQSRSEEGVAGDAHQQREALIVSADTMIFFENQLLGKPATIDVARTVLKAMQGKRQQVLSGVCVISVKTGEMKALFHETTEVEFADVDDATIEWYLQTGEPIGKAGSYAIQGIGSMLVSGIHGCFWNVMGFPIHRFLAVLSSIQSS